MVTYLRVSLLLLSLVRVGLTNDPGDHDPAISSDSESMDDVSELMMAAAEADRGPEAASSSNLAGGQAENRLNIVGEIEDGDEDPEHSSDGSSSSSSEDDEEEDDQPRTFEYRSTSVPNLLGLVQPDVLLYQTLFDCETTDDCCRFRVYVTLEKEYQNLIFGPDDLDPHREHTYISSSSKAEAVTATKAKFSCFDVVKWPPRAFLFDEAYSRGHWFMQCPEGALVRTKEVPKDHNGERTREEYEADPRPVYHIDTVKAECYYTDGRQIRRITIDSAQARCSDITVTKPSLMRILARGGDTLARYWYSVTSSAGASTSREPRTRTHRGRSWEVPINAEELYKVCVYNSAKFPQPFTIELGASQVH